MLQVQNLTKHFHSFRVINNVSLELRSGEILGILGPVGAGKTTLFRVLVGLLPYDSGSIHPTNGAWPTIGFKPERLDYPDKMTVHQYLSMMASMSGFVAKSETSSVVEKSLKVVGLSLVGHSKIRQCSKAMRQRIGLAQAMLGNPDILILDEPCAGLDAAGQRDIQAILRMLRGQGKSVVISSHRLEEVKAVCTEIAILSRGEIAYKSAYTKATDSSASARIICDSDLHSIRPLLELLHPDIKVLERSVEIGSRAIPFRRDILRLLLSAGHDVLRIERPEIPLNKVYAQVIRQ